ncbi:putative anion transporter 4, chloroplastic isoform X1 [Senna tora]|uniref:Putative anion transporter 4, chloroplastic isoform X1 n=1 Tax=Senna tora TaxID=362788 RepID=A0A834WBA1_9FABA|nr:putative anion transporter 4, chloroplastic isoform X1 [Senna tora]
MSSAVTPSAFVPNSVIGARAIPRSPTHTTLQSPKSPLFSSRFFAYSQNSRRFGNASERQKFQFWNAPVDSRSTVRSLPRLKVSSDDAQFSSIPDEKQAKQQQKKKSNFAEFITSERVKVVAMLALALALCNADRVVMSVAIVPLSLANGWSRAFSGIVQSSFLWGYLISPIAGGVLVDNYGGKVVMAWGVALWSLATFLTPWAAETSLWALLAVRTLLGIAEGVALPSMNNMVARWFPQTERSRAVGIAMAGFQLGCAIGLTLSPILMSQGATSSTPDRSPQISKYELEYILNKRKKSFPVETTKPSKVRVTPPFRRLLSKQPTWSLLVANGMHSWGFFVVLSWMPIYFNSVYHVDLRHAAWFSAGPWVLMAIMNYVAGLWSDMMIQSGISVTLTRRIVQSIGFVGPGICLVGVAMAKNPSIASAWLTLAFGLKSFSHSGFLVNIQEIAPKYSGVLHGLALTAGTLAAILGTVGAGFFVDLVGSFQGFLLLTSFLYFLSALFYCLFSTGERVNFDEPGEYDILLHLS